MAMIKMIRQRRILPFEGFNKTVDEFFSSIEGQRLESRLHERELTAKKKLEAAKQDQQKRLGGLQEVQELNERKAAAIEANVERVQEAMDAVNGLIAQGMDWVEIGKLIEVEQKRRNPVASIIKLPLKLHENTITLLLDEETFVDDDDSAYQTDSDVSDSEDEASKKELAKKEQDQRLTIDINLGVSPWSNAREYYDQRRSAADKETKTLQSSTKALKSTEQKINQDLRKGLKLEKAILRPVRRQMFFEKFIWFISSDGYLVLGGRDAQQNEILYKKYLRKGDVYVHADMQGAASIVIRNNPSTPDAPIPPSTLSQAGTLAVASSSAWDSKAGMGAWWVYADQVSKSAPTGEFLPTGSFMVRGTKNFLPPAQLLLGFGVMFHISDDSRSNHSKHRLQSSDTDNGLDKPQVKGDLINSKDIDGSDDENLQNASDEDAANTQIYEAEDEDLSDKHANPLQSAGNSIADKADEEEPPRGDANIEGISQLSRKGQSTKHEDVSDIEHPNENNGDANVDAEPQEDQDADADVSSADAGPSSSTPQQKQKGPAPLPRGKRSKAKKAAAKYKYQDEEDRLAAQELMGSAAGRAKAEEEAEAKARNDATAAFHKERRKQQHQRTLEETAKHEQARKAMLEAGEVIDDDTTEAEKDLILDTFVGTPLPGDEILDAIPVCAPWTAMGRYKYKIKLQPGAVKKGKAVKEILAKWMADVSPKYVDQQSKDVEKMWPREIELLKGFRVEECVNVVPVGKVRVMMSGGAMGGVASNKGQGKAKGGGGKGGKKSR
jgi:hypothetical protein